jgi:glycosyltransferase involved in cell wall biosynthesis
LLRIKGFGLAIKAFKAFVEKHPDAEFELVGSGPEEQKLRALVRRIHGGSKVHFVPAMPRGELLRKMAAADVFLFPSLRDGGGTVAIEAMAVGKPVICLDVGGPGMHITEECGIKVTPGSPSDTVHRLADALERLYLDKDLRHRLGKAAQEKAKRSYHWDRLGERLMEIYQPAIQRTRSN